MVANTQHRRDATISQRVIDASVTRRHDPFLEILIP